MAVKHCQHVSLFAEKGKKQRKGRAGVRSYWRCLHGDSLLWRVPPLLLPLTCNFCSPPFRYVRCGNAFLKRKSQLLVRSCLVSVFSLRRSTVIQVFFFCFVFSLTSFLSCLYTARAPVRKLLTLDEDLKDARASFLLARICSSAWLAETQTLKPSLKLCAFR